MAACPTLVFRLSFHAGLALEHVALPRDELIIDHLAARRDRARVVEHPVLVVGRQCTIDLGQAGTPPLISQA